MFALLAVASSTVFFNLFSPCSLSRVQPSFSIYFRLAHCREFNRLFQFIFRAIAEKKKMLARQSFALVTRRALAPCVLNSSGFAIASTRKLSNGGSAAERRSAWLQKQRADSFLCLAEAKLDSKSYQQEYRFHRINDGKDTDLLQLMEPMRRMDFRELSAHTHLVEGTATRYDIVTLKLETLA